VKDKLKKKAAGKKAGKKRQPKPRTPEAADAEAEPEDGMGGEAPEESGEPETLVSRIMAAKNSEELKLLNEEVHKRLLAEEITNERQMELMSMLHTRSMEIAKGK